MKRRSPAPTLRVTAVQMKFRRTVHENVGWICETIAAAAKDGSDAILFPECAVTGYAIDFKTIRPAEIDAARVRIAAAARTNASPV